MKNKEVAYLQELERGVQTMLTDKFWDIIVNKDEDYGIRAKVLTIVGRALGETLDEFRYPIHWERLLKRKDCPKYMKTIQHIHVNAYYPKLSMPEEQNWLTLDKGEIDD